MHVELDEKAAKRGEDLVREGAYPSAEAAVNAAVAKLEHPDFDGIDVERAWQDALADVAAGRVHDVTPEFLSDLRAQLEERIRRRT